jgi:phosphocarrier protein
MAQKVSAHVIIPNKRGLHARASAKIVEASARFQSDIHVIKDGTAVNGRSSMGLMMLAASIGARVEITAEGPDQDEALKAILALVEVKLGEEHRNDHSSSVLPTRPRDALLGGRGRKGKTT